MVGGVSARAAATKPSSDATSWVPVPAGSPFPLTNLPYGVVSHQGGRPHPAVAIGDQVLSLAAAVGLGLFTDVVDDAERLFYAPTLNRLMSRGPAVWQAVRDRVIELFTDVRHRPTVTAALLPLAEVTCHLPIEVADYVDFYSSEHHVANVGRIFRPNGVPVPPHWWHLPIGYHGRAGTVVVSGTPIVRPRGLRAKVGSPEPEFGPSVRLDVEAEVGFVVGVPSRLGEPVGLSGFEEHVFGVVLLNDWSARDIQAYETQPLGPFLGKSFATSISPWVVPLAALRAARVAPPERRLVPAGYLHEGECFGYDLALSLRLNDAEVSRPPFAGMYWTAAQQLAHLTVNGASLRTGDLYASGTVSGPEQSQRGSLLELTWNGTEPLELPGGARRTFLADGDTVTITATAPGVDGTTIGFGEVTGTVRPAPVR
jgi:fumarylacetoacetase